ncbi:hypothetical protein HN51_065081 [Arachis hypogaea]|uniref:Cystatin domain-containing protein n=1 Tax=Arachis hypogaea TaxID=3818 RepID=A0A444ZCZ8_ARAHY|nr:Cysteine proteinase inhibitor [Arachis hypogaea]RYR12047.1 hypothetical protein Ahy_B04g069561 [Arachis hypogaea]
MRTYCCLIMLFLFLLAPLCYSSSASLMSVTPPINLNVKESWVIEIAKFAVTEHNKRSSANLKLEKLLSCRASSSAFSSTYTLELLANNGAETNKYTAQLLEIITSSTYKLQTFELAPFPPPPL